MEKDEEIGALKRENQELKMIHGTAKKIKANPSFSYTYEDRESFRARFLKEGSLDEGVPFTLRRKIILTLFILAFPLMVWGVSMAGWWFPQMAAPSLPSPSSSFLSRA